jgi:hypothetical protein
MHLIKYSSEFQDLFFSFCKTQSLEIHQQSSVNLWDDDWENKSYTLPFLLEKTPRFSENNGLFQILINDHEIIGCSGVYISSFDPYISLAGVRTWIRKDFRHLHLNKDYFLKSQKQWSIERGIKIIALSFNDYNKNIIQIFKRNRLGESSDRLKRSKEHLFFNGINEVPFSVNIQNTQQWVIYEKINLEYEFPWESIKWK